MSAAAAVRLVPAAWNGDVRELVDRFADAFMFEASPAQRAEIACRAEDMLASETPDAGAVRDLKFDLLTADWKTRAQAAARLSDDGVWTRWDVAGSLGSARKSGGARREAARAAAAIVVAARETLSPDLSERHGRLKGPARAAAAHETDGALLWDDAARPLASVFAANARMHGADRRTAALRALAAAAHLKGAALAAAAPADPFLLGAAASTLLRPKTGGRASTRVHALGDLARAVAALNSAREALWTDVDAETSRLMGAAAACAAFGRGSVARPAPHASGQPLGAHLPQGVLRFADLAASEAAAALDAEAADPRVDAHRRRRLETLSEVLRRHAAAHAVSLAEALDVEPPASRTSELRPGMKVYRTAAHGLRRPVVCEGKNGRAVRCRAVAGPDGALVGYLAFDALSREFGGRPLYAAYALDGARYGYAYADDRPVIRRGEPEQGFMTAPERIPA